MPDIQNTDLTQITMTDINGNTYKISVDANTLAQVVAVNLLTNAINNLAMRSN